MVSGPSVITGPVDHSVPSSQTFCQLAPLNRSVPFNLNVFCGPGEERERVGREGKKCLRE